MMGAGEGNCSLGLEQTLEINDRNYHWSGGSEFCRCCEGEISESIEHVFLLCTLYEEKGLVCFKA